MHVITQEHTVIRKKKKTYHIARQHHDIYRHFQFSHSQLRRISLCSDWMYHLSSCWQSLVSAAPIPLSSAAKCHRKVLSLPWQQFVKLFPLWVWTGSETRHYRPRSHPAWFNSNEVNFKEQTLSSLWHSQRESQWRVQGRAVYFRTECLKSFIYRRL